MSEVITLTVVEYQALVDQRNAALEEQTRLLNLLADLEARIAVLEGEEAGPEKPVEPETLKFDSFDEAEAYLVENGLPRLPHTADSFTLKLAAGRRKDPNTGEHVSVDTRPIAAVEIQGRKYFPKPPQAGGEWYHIAHSEIEDVTRENYWFDPMGVPWTNNRMAMENNLRNYKGGLNFGLFGWPDWAARVYLETHEAPAAPTRRPPAVTRGG